VPIGTTTLTVTPTVNQTNATLTVNGHAAVSGAAYGPISLAIGDNIITIVVTASDSTTDTYKVTVTRPVGAPVAVSVAVDPTTIRSTEATLLGTLDANGAPSVAGNSAPTRASAPGLTSCLPRRVPPRIPPARCLSNCASRIWCRKPRITTAWWAPMTTARTTAPR
jgi:Cadherin-like beta sandwich domain